MKGLVTGLELVELKGRGRPPTYVNATARRMHNRWVEFQRLIYEVATETGFTPEAEKMWRAEFFRLGNLLNYNKLKHVRKNPARPLHAQLVFGMPYGACGYAVTSERSDAITENFDLVTCEDCRALNYGDELARGL